MCSGNVEECCGMCTSTTTKIFPFLSKTSKLGFVTLRIFAMLFIVWPVLYHNCSAVIKPCYRSYHSQHFLKGWQAKAQNQLMVSSVWGNSSQALPGQITGGLTEHTRQITEAHLQRPKNSTRKCSFCNSVKYQELFKHFITAFINNLPEKADIKELCEALMLTNWF